MIPAGETSLFEDAPEFRPVRGLGFREYHRLLRTHGGRTERRSYAMCWLLFAVMLVPAITLFWAVWNHWLPFEWLYGWGLAAATVGAYCFVVASSTFNARMYQAMLENGQLSGYEEEIREYIRYAGDRGKDGQIPGMYAWAAAAFVVYVAMMAAALVFAFALQPALGTMTPYAFAALDAAVTGGFLVAWFRWNRRVIREAAKIGYRLRRRANRPQSSGP